MAEFKLSEEEGKAYHKWVNEHIEKHHGGKEPYGGAIGGNYSFIVTNTSLGQIVHTYCSFCKSKVLGTEASNRLHDKTNTDIYQGCLTNFDDW